MVSDIPTGDGKIAYLFLPCRLTQALFSVYIIQKVNVRFISLSFFYTFHCQFWRTFPDSFFHLKGMSHENDLAFDDMHGQFGHWSVLGVIWDAAGFKIFWFSNDFITEKVYFSRLMLVCLLFANAGG